jgi:CrcB protein
VDRGPLVRAFAGTGLLGGFTTFSTYAVQTSAQWRADRPVLSLVYLFATLGCCLAAAALGAALIRRRHA